MLWVYHLTIFSRSMKHKCQLSFASLSIWLRCCLVWFLSLYNPLQICKIMNVKHSLRRAYMLSIHCWLSHNPVQKVLPVMVTGYVWYCIEMSICLEMTPLYRRSYWNHIKLIANQRINLLKVFFSIRLIWQIHSSI